MERMERMAYSVAEVAEQLNIGAKSVRELIRCGKLQAIGVGPKQGRWRIPAAAIDDYLKREMRAYATR